MSKLACYCNHIIVDNTDDLPYKAHFYRDADYEHAKRYLTDIADFVEAIKNGKRDGWIREYFKDESYIEYEDRWIISNIPLHYLHWESIMYQCEACGRLYVDRGKNIFEAFLPQDDNWKELFKGFSDNKND